MAQVLVTESYLDDIADAIRDKNGSEDTYTPAQMAGAIEDIHTADEVVLVSKSVTANGTYNPASDSADGYSGVTVDVPNTYTESDNGKVVVNQTLTAQTSKNINANGTHDTTANNSVVVDVPNSYAAADEGKVVSSGELVSQTSRNISENGTYDTTLNNEVVVNAHADAVLYKFVDPNYYMDETGLICTIINRAYNKKYADPAFVAYFYTGSYTGPLLLSKTQNGATFSSGQNTYTPSAITINDETWYVSSSAYFMAGDQTSSAGFAKKLYGTYATMQLAGEALYAVAYDNTITQNGVYNVPEGYDGFDSFEVAVSPNLETKNIYENGTYTPTEGKDGFSSVFVNVSGGGGSGSVLSGIDDPSDSQGSNGAIYLKYFDKPSLPNGYTAATYIEFVSDAYIDTGIIPTDHCTELYVNDVSYVNDKHWIGTSKSYTYYHFTTYQNRYAWGYNGSEGGGGSYSSGEHYLKFNTRNDHYIILDGVVLGTGLSKSSTSIYIGRRQSTANASNFRVYSCKIYDNSNGDIVRNLVPCTRDLDSVVGMYDVVNDVFYQNAGSGTFTAGSGLIDKKIMDTYCKVNGVWQNLIGSSIDDVNI